MTLFWHSFSKRSTSSQCLEAVNKLWTPFSLQMSSLINRLQWPSLGHMVWWFKTASMKTKTNKFHFEPTATQLLCYSLFCLLASLRHISSSVLEKKTRKLWKIAWLSSKISCFTFFMGSFYELSEENCIFAFCCHSCKIHRAFWEISSIWSVSHRKSSVRELFKNKDLTFDMYPFDTQHLNLPKVEEEPHGLRWKGEMGFAVCSDVMRGAIFPISIFLLFSVRSYPACQTSNSNISGIPPSLQTILQNPRVNMIGDTN